MKPPPNKTKIVATIGPASMERDVMEQMLRAGMNVARLNFSHGDFEQHGLAVRRLRAAAKAVGRRVAVMADLPGPKMRLGEIPGGPVELDAGDAFVLTSDAVDGSRHRASMSFEQLPRVVKKGDRLFLNDGLVQLEVDRVEGNEVCCTVRVGGEISSRKGLNLPGIPLGIHAFTDHDRECLACAVSLGVDAVSQSFVECAEDIDQVRAAAAELDAKPFLIAKIERHAALENFDEILRAADGIMVARGDLGVEVPIEDMAVTQKRLIECARKAAKPVITATQMLESMTASRLPTRAEATDVANAILDGTDCVMLSAESAAGRFPVEAVAMLSRIAVSVEAHREKQAEVPHLDVPEVFKRSSERKAMLVEHTFAIAQADAVLAPTQSGQTARAVARMRPPVWVLGAGADRAAMQGLAFSYGVHPVDLEEEPEDWNDFARRIVKELEIPAKTVLLVAGPSPANPHANLRLELIEI